MDASPETSDRERELKFEIGSGGLRSPPDHPALALPARTTRLRSVYFDTPDHDLRRAGLSLRVREADGRFVQTVKQGRGAGGFERGEWECEVATDQLDPAAWAETPAAGVLGEDKAPAPVFSTVVDRSVRVWRDGETTIEISVDEGEIVAGDLTQQIRELELELEAGDPAALFALARELSASLPLRLSFDSKGERGYRMVGRDETAALKAEQAAVAADTPAAAAFRRIALSRIAHVAGSAQMLRRVRSPDALHQTRVGLRGLRAALTAFKPMLDHEGMERLKAEAKWLAGELDEARDLDVFIQSTWRPAAQAAVEEDFALAALGKRLLEAQTRAYDRALAALDSPRFARLLLEATAWVEVGDWLTREDPVLQALRESPVADFGADALDRLRKQVVRRGKGLRRLDPAGRHKLRIKAKVLRYAADFLAPAYDAAKARRKFATALKAMQDCLGELNDLAVAETTAKKAAGPRAPDLAFAAGLIVGRGRAREAALLDQARKAYRDFKQAKPFWER